MIQSLNFDEVFLKISKLGITGRNLELLMPLLLTNYLISSEHFDNFLQIGAKIMEKKKSEEYAESKDVTLYDFVGTWLQETKEYKSIKSLTSEFRAFCGDTDQDDRWLNDRWVGRALTRLGLIIEKRRVSSGMEVILNNKKAQEKLKIFSKHE
jgi:hypothetical protein